MSDTKKQELYKKGLELASQGKNQLALETILEYLKSFPNDIEAGNDAGALYYSLGQTEKAIDILEDVWQKSPDSGEVCWNLTEAYLSANMPENAVRQFATLEKSNLLNFDTVNRAAKLFADKGDKANAIEMLLYSLKLCPNQDVLNSMIELLKITRPKIAFFNGLGDDTKFLKDIIDFTADRFEVKIFSGTTTQQVSELMDWADIAWFEWCTDMLAAATAMPKKCKIIARLHRFEAYEIFPKKVVWENVDNLILVGNSYVRKQLTKSVPQIERRTKIITIPNGINTDAYKFLNQPKGKNIACIGYLNMRKNPMFLLQCMQKLNFIDKEYKLFFAGNFQDPMLEQYIQYMVRQLDLNDVVFFQGWQDDIADFLYNKHFIVSSSIGESQGLGVLEGMSCGLKPLIHNFPGATEIFDSKYIFNIAEQFCDMIISDDYNPSEYRAFVEKTYPQKKQLNDINAIFASMEKSISKISSNSSNFAASY